jgi:glucose-6-phosphate isomerase
MLCGSLLRIFHSRQSTGGAAMVDSLLTHFDPLTGVVPGAQPTVRHLSDLRGCFGDTKAYERAVAAGNPAVYTVVNVDRSSEPGALGFSVNCIRPGSVGAEYHLTRGHLHAERSAAEVYVGVSGSGAMLLQHEHSGECRLVPLVPNSVVYVAGHTAHRTINTGDVPLVYLGVYLANAGHDYAAVAHSGFRCRVIVGSHGPVLVERAAFDQAADRSE